MGSNIEPRRTDVAFQSKLNPKRTLEPRQCGDQWILAKVTTSVKSVLVDGLAMTAKCEKDFVLGTVEATHCSAAIPGWPQLP